MKRILPILCFVLACTFFPVHAQNLVANPGFETPASSQPTNWNITTPFNGASTQNWQLAEGLAPVINKSLSSLSGFSYTPGSGPSAQQSFTISGSNLTTGITVKIPAEYEISTNSGSNFVALTSPFTISRQSNGSISPLTLYVRLKAGLAINTYTGIISLISGSLMDSIALSGSVVPPLPIITTSTAKLSGFTYTEGSGPSAQQSFTVSGSNLASGIAVFPPESIFEISINSGAAFSPITSRFVITQSGGTVPATNLYVRIKAGVAAGNYSEIITLTTIGGLQTITLNGTVTVPEGVTLSTTSLSGFNYYIGAGPSYIQLFSISGTSLTSSVVITPPNDYEISDTENPFTATGMILLVPSDGNIASTPIYVRLKSGLPVSVYNENISVYTNDYPTKTVALSGNVLLSTEIDETPENEVNVYTSGARIVVVGTTQGETISLYSTTGMRLQTLRSKGEKVEISAQPGAIYLVKTTSKTFKVIL